jgi:phosphoribosyl-ATP pyrophosphohydrolase/phosphoribosyl-AMP cyclohydrolase
MASAIDSTVLTWDERNSMQADLNYDKNGLIPAIIQDDTSGDVLTLFWMNEEAVARTLESKRVWRYSRQHQQLMLKGDTSGHFLDVKGMLYDCDADALVVRVDPTGPACHTGERTCFYRELTGGPEAAVSS